MGEFMRQSIKLLDSEGIFATTVIVNKGLGWIYITLSPQFRINIQPTYMIIILQKILRIITVSWSYLQNSLFTYMGNITYVRNLWMQQYYLWRLSKILNYVGKKGYVL